MVMFIHCIGSSKYFYVKNPNLQRSTMYKKIFGFIWLKFCVPVKMAEVSQLTGMHLEMRNKLGVVFVLL